MAYVLLPPKTLKTGSLSKSDEKIYKTIIRPVLAGSECCATTKFLLGF